MKNLLIIFTIILTTNIYAASKVPPPFRNSIIKRRLRNGRMQMFDGNRYMIVRRKSKRKIPTKKSLYKKNAIKAFLGYGPNEIKSYGNKAVLDKDSFLGIGYQRMLNDKLSIEVIGTTNESLMLGGGLHF